MLPTPTPTTIPVSIAGHVFTFRRLTWRDDMRFHIVRKTQPKMSLLAYALAEVDGRRVDNLTTAGKLVGGLPLPVRERLVVL
jgi:hypothetical protein